jgi:lipid-binding SYLF domain-containing protein
MRATCLTLLAVATMAMVGCETNSPDSQANHADLNQRSRTTVQQMTAQDPKLQDLINSSVGYVIFPEIGQGAVGVGGASGTGVLYRNGQSAGWVKLNQLSVGPQVGGQTYSELIVFQNDDALNRLMNNSLEFGTEASATIVKAGAAAAANFRNGMAVYILPKGGLEAGANINGQKFHYSGNYSDVNSYSDQSR